MLDPNIRHFAIKLYRLFNPRTIILFSVNHSEDYQRSTRAHPVPSAATTTPHAHTAHSNGSGSASGSGSGGSSGAHTYGTRRTARLQSEEGMGSAYGCGYNENNTTAVHVLGAR